MYAITGITGQVGGALARTLQAAGLPIRAVVRDAAKAGFWKDQGCEAALAAMDDAVALTAAFRGAQGVFILLPPVFDPAPDFGEARAFIAALKSALAAARPDRVVCLSTIGAQVVRPNLLGQLSLLERELGDLDLPLCFLRPGWFMENAAWDVVSAREQGLVASFLQPLDRPVPMVATADVGRVAAELLQQHWRGTRVVELEGPQRVAPVDIAAAFARLLSREVRAEIVPRETWQALFTSQGMKNPLPRMQMLDGFNEEWIRFEGAALKGRVDLDAVLGELLVR